MEDEYYSDCGCSKIDGHDKSCPLNDDMSLCPCDRGEPEECGEHSDCDHGNATSASLSTCTMTPECVERNKCPLDGLHVYIGYKINKMECCSKCGRPKGT